MEFFSISRTWVILLTEDPNGIPGHIHATLSLEMLTSGIPRHTISAIFRELLRDKGVS